MPKRPIWLLSVLVLASLSWLALHVTRSSGDNVSSEHSRPEPIATPGADVTRDFVVPDDVSETDPDDTDQWLDVYDADIEPSAQFAKPEPEEPLDATARARLLQDMFMTSHREFGDRLETHVLHTSVDDDWSPAAAATLEEMFREWTAGEEFIVDCVSDMCMLDLSISSRDLVTKVAPRFRGLRGNYPAGFLPTSCYFNEGGGVFRFYFFRDTFDPGLL